MASELQKKNEPAPKAKDFALLLLETITHTPGLNAPLLSARLGRSLRTTQRYLKELTENNQISYRGVAKKGGYYPESQGQDK